MASRQRKLFFAQEEIEALQRVFDGACSAFGVGRDETELRAQLAQVVFEIAKTGESDETVITELVVGRFLNSAAARGRVRVPMPGAIHVLQSRWRRRPWSAGR